MGDHHDSLEWLRVYCIARVYPYLDRVDDSNTELCALLWVLNKGVLSELASGLIYVKAEDVLASARVSVTLSISHSVPVRFPALKPRPS